MTSVRKRLNVLVPFRDRHEHLRTLLPVLARHLRTIPHRVVVIEQADRKPFNKGVLLNAGASIARACDYYCLHDVDMLPAWRPEVRSAYAFTRSVVHLAGRCEQHRFRRPYFSHFGGVLLVNKRVFFAINGFSNKYRGWGKEDDDLYARVRFAGFRITFKPYRFRSLPHDGSYRGNHAHFAANCRRYERMARGKVDFRLEGVSSLSYTLQSRDVREGCDWIRITT
jgi:predicted glycosyltransferase involved in capsule biosynthesis